MSVETRRFAVNSVTAVVTIGVSLLAAAVVSTAVVLLPAAMNVFLNSVFAVDEPVSAGSNSVAVVAGAVFALVTFAAVQWFVGRRLYKYLFERYVSASVAYRNEIRNRYGQLSFQEKRAVYESMSPERREAFMRELDPVARGEFARLHESLAS